MDETQVIKRELAHADLFLDMDDLLLELVASVSYMQAYRAGDIIFSENGISDEMYIIIEGEVEISVNAALIAGGDTHNAPHKTIATLRRGQNFGEVALLDEGRRTATAICTVTTTELIIIPRERLMRVCENVPKLGYRLMYNLANDLATKIRNTDLTIRAQLLWRPSER